AERDLGSEIGPVDARATVFGLWTFQEFRAQSEQCERSWACLKSNTHRLRAQAGRNFGRIYSPDGGGGVNDRVRGGYASLGASSHWVFPEGSNRLMRNNFSPNSPAKSRKSRHTDFRPFSGSGSRRRRLKLDGLTLPV